MIPKKIEEVLNTIAAGAENGNLCVFECDDKEGNPVYVLSVSFDIEGGTHTYPLARIFTHENGDDPFSLYEAPDGAVQMRPDGEGGQSPVH